MFARRCLIAAAGKRGFGMSRWHFGQSLYKFTSLWKCAPWPIRIGAWVPSSWH